MSISLSVNGQSILEDIAFMLFIVASATMVVIIVRYVSIETALRAKM